MMDYTIAPDGLNPVAINCIRTFPGRGVREWDVDVKVAEPDAGLIHGNIYVEQLEFCNRTTPACADAAQRAPASHHTDNDQLHEVIEGQDVCSAPFVTEPGDNSIPVSTPRFICGDIAWEQG